METDFAFPFDILTRPSNFKHDDQVYTIIVAETHYATATSENAKVIDQRSEATVAGPTGLVKATLIETSRDAGDDFAALLAGDIAPPPDGDLEEWVSEWVYCLVFPKSEETLENWFDKYVRPISVRAELPTAPFWWLLSKMFINDPVTIRFKIRYAPHIIGGEDGNGTDPMVQMYPMSGICSAQYGWSVYAYRTDPDTDTENPATGPKFGSPPRWRTAVITPGFIGAPRGLRFGTDPPLIAADVPYEG